MRFNSGRSFAALLVLLLLSVSTTVVDARDKTAQRYMKLYFKISAKAEEGRWDDVLKLTRKMERLAPGADLHLVYAAQANAQLGNRDTALDALERLIEPGWRTTDGLMKIEKIAPLHGDPRFEELSERAARMGEAFKVQLHTLHRRLPFADAEAFESAQALIDRFESITREFNERSILIPGMARQQRRYALLDEEIAAAGRYLQDKPEAEDRDQAALAAVRAANKYRQYDAQMENDASIVFDTAKRFLEGWPDSEHRPEVELVQAIATWKAFGEDDQAETVQRRANEANGLLEALEAGFGESPEATKAKIWRLNIAMELSDANVTPAITDLYGQVEPALSEDEELQRYAWQEAPRAMFQINGEKLFDGVDLDGTRWNWETMKGKVVLIDFWATWCGPCVADIPQLKETYDKYRDAGFRIVGVSLDRGGKDEFLEECGDLGVEWPQIFDGKGWDSVLAKSFNVWGIPTPVLLDRDGRVVGVHGDVRGEKLMEQVAKLMDAETESP